jgi:hypothetical protein
VLIVSGTREKPVDVTTATLELSRLLGADVPGSPLSNSTLNVTSVSTAAVMFRLMVVSTLAAPACSRAIWLPSNGSSTSPLPPRSVALDTTDTSHGKLAVKPSSVPSSKSSVLHEYGDAVGVGGTGVAVLDSDASCVLDAEGVTGGVRVGVDAGVRHLVPELEAVLVAVAVLVRVCVGVTAELRVPVDDAVREEVPVDDREPVAVAVGVRDGVVNAVCVLLAVFVDERVAESVGSDVCVHVGVSDTDADGDPDAVPDAEPDDVSDGDMVDDAVLVGVCPLEPLTVDVSDLLTVGVLVLERVRVRLRDDVGVPVVDAV